MKREISLALVVAMLLTLMMPTVAFGAVDYSGHWAEKTIQEWFDNSKLKGYEDGSFRPDVQITRAEFMTMVNNAFDYTKKADISFEDVESDDWYYPEVQKAVQAGYLKGYEDNTARPENKISRQEAALIIARIKKLSDSASGASRFTDINEIALWAKGGVGAVAKAKLMIGYEDNTFRPLRFISRAESLVTIDRAYETPSTGGGGGSSSDDDGGETQVTTEAAIISSFTIKDSTTTASITTPSELTTTAVTPSAIFTTTSSAITISAITVPEGADIAVTVTTSSGITTTPSGITTTYSAINGVVNINLNDVGYYTIELVVSKSKTARIEYIPTKYTFIVERQ